jgi:hypothetical protein
VDFAAKAIILLSGHEHLKKRFFHIVNPAPILQDQMLDHLKTLGYPMESIPYDEWCVQLSKEESNPLYALLPIFTEILANGLTQAQLAEHQPRVSAPKTDDLLTQFALECPGISQGLISKYVEWIFRELAAVKKTG